MEEITFSQIENKEAYEVSDFSNTEEFCAILLRIPKYRNKNSLSPTEIKIDLFPMPNHF